VDANTVIAICGVVIAVASLGVSAYVAWAARKHNRLAVRPNTRDLRRGGLHDAVTWDFAAGIGRGLRWFGRAEGSWYGFGCRSPCRFQEPWCLLICLPLPLQAGQRNPR